jgi:hypothetical protein
MLSFETDVLGRQRVGRLHLPAPLLGRKLGHGPSVPHLPPARYERGVQTLSSQHPTHIPQFLAAIEFPQYLQLVLSRELTANGPLRYLWCHILH